MSVDKPTIHHTHLHLWRVDQNRWLSFAGRTCIAADLRTSSSSSALSQSSNTITESNRKDARVDSDTSNNSEHSESQESGHSRVLFGLPDKSRMSHSAWRDLTITHSAVTALQRACTRSYPPLRVHVHVFPTQAPFCPTSSRRLDGRYQRLACHGCTTSLFSPLSLFTSPYWCISWT